MNNVRVVSIRFRDPDTKHPSLSSTDRFNARFKTTKLKKYEVAFYGLLLICMTLRENTQITFKFIVFHFSENHIDSDLFSFFIRYEQNELMTVILI